jgi:hypothetical protein
LSGQTVTFDSTDSGQSFGSTTDHGNGGYTATLQGSTTPGAATITATDGALSDSTTVTQANLEIQEFRFVGPSGAAGDGYVELYNDTAARVALNRWALVYTDATGAQVTLTLLPNVLVPAYGHFLVADSQYDSTLSAVAAPDQSWTSPITPVRVELTVPGHSSDVDDVGFDNGALGTPLNAPTVYPSGQFAWVRRYQAGQPQNTGDNASDFQFVSSTDDGTPTTGAGSPVPGVPGPLNTGSAVDENAFLQSSLLQPSAAAGASPNAVYTAGSPGTLVINRTVTNCSGINSGNASAYPAACANAELNTSAVAVNNIQFRVTGLSTGVLRAETSSGGTFGGDPAGPLTLDIPSITTQGLNAVWNGTANIPSGGLQPGASITVSFQFSVIAHGSYTFAYNSEDDLTPYTGPLPGSTPPAASAPAASATAAQPVAVAPVVSGVVSSSGVTATSPAMKSVRKAPAASKHRLKTRTHKAKAKAKSKRGTAKKAARAHADRRHAGARRR